MKKYINGIQILMVVLALAVVILQITGALSRRLTTLEGVSYARDLELLIFLSAVVLGYLFFLLVERPIDQFLKTHFLTGKITQVPA